MKTCWFFAIWIFLSASASACSCSSSDNGLEDAVTSAFSLSDDVYVAEVTDTDRIRIAWFGEKSTPGLRLKLVVRRSFKGSNSVGSIVLAETAKWGAACGTPYSKGAVLLVYANGPPPLELKLCQLSGELVELLEHIPILLRLSESKSGDSSGR